MCSLYKQAVLQVCIHIQMRERRENAVKILCSSGWTANFLRMKSNICNVSESVVRQFHMPSIKPCGRRLSQLQHYHV